MPRKRYYCDFCYKSFADNKANRQNHLNGVQHKLAKKSHYDSFKEPEQILAEDSGREPCHKYFTEGNCKFGNTCKYSHISNQEREIYIREVNAKKQIESTNCLQNIDAQNIVEKWLSEKNLDFLHSAEGQINQYNLPLKLPDSFFNQEDIPLSLMPYDISKINKFSDWG